MDDMKVEFLRTIEVFLLDLDGTLYLGDSLLPGAKEFLDLLGVKNRQFLILTNNSSLNRSAYQKKLARMGIQVHQNQVFTSGDATLYSLNRNHPGARLFVAGTRPLKNLFRAAGYPVVEENPEVVIVGFDTSITYHTLRKTCDLVRAGLPYLATHPDLNCPVEDGFIPDTGATIAFIAASTGRQPDEICGKPFPAMVAAIRELTHREPEKIAMVGDRLNTDIAMGQAGIRTILVLSGETSMEQLKDSRFQPDLVIPGIASLSAILSTLEK